MCKGPGEETAGYVAGVAKRPEAAQSELQGMWQGLRREEWMGTRSHRAVGGREVGQI